MHTIERIIRGELGMYRQYTATIALYELWLAAFEDRKTINELALLYIRLTALNCLLSMLNPIEKIIVQREMIDGISRDQVLEELQYRHQGKRCYSQAMLQNMEQNALRKMVDFAVDHQDIVLAIFDGHMELREFETPRDHDEEKEKEA